MLTLYFRLIAIHLRSQMQYRFSFLLDALGSGLGSFTEFVSFLFIFLRFGSIGGWSIGEVAFLYGIVEMGFATMDMVFSGYDPSTFSQLIRKGTLDQMLLRPINLPMQVFTSEFVLRRLGRVTQGLLVLVVSLSINHIDWTLGKILYLPFVYLSVTAFFGGLFIFGATTCFWTVEASEAINIFTYGGSYMLTYPMHIYADWLRKFFTFILPGALIVYYPALYFLDKPDPTGFSPLMSFLSPLVGVGVLTLSFVAWHIGLRHYTSTGT